MQLGIQLGASAAGGQSSHESIDLAMWAARFADEAGFDHIWTTEHHFTENIHTGAPGAILAYVAGVTERAKLGYAVSIVPLHHPLLLAEEFAWVDNLSKGRLIAGISPGWAAYEFKLLGVPHEERRERLAESFEIITRALTNEPFSYQGRYFQIPEMRLFPPPRQKRIPFAMSCNQNESVRRAARWRVSPLLGFPPAPELFQQRQVFIDTCREEGVPEDEIAELVSYVGVRKFITIAKTDEEAEAIALAGTQQLQGTLKRLLTTAGAHDALESTVRTPSGAMVTLDHEDVRESPIFGNHLYGSVDTVIEKLLDLERVGGMAHCICVFGGGENGVAGSKQAIELFAKEVIPAVKQHSTSRGPRGASGEEAASLRTPPLASGASSRACSKSTRRSSSPSCRKE
ncbi:MAG: luciferase [Dehalococcoidia bacterium]|nr:MAG: luciferase [Dehalococcoidia bacterium]